MLLNNKENVFEQIANNYKKLIITGVLKYGEYLPSCRDLAKELGINPNTVQKAYTLLEDSGYVTKVIKKGVYVSYNENNKDLLNEFRNNIFSLRNKEIPKDELKNIIDEVYEE